MIILNIKSLKSTVNIIKIIIKFYCTYAIKCVIIKNAIN